MSRNRNLAVGAIILVIVLIAALVDFSPSSSSPSHSSSSSSRRATSSSEFSPELLESLKISPAAQLAVDQSPEADARRLVSAAQSIISVPNSAGVIHRHLAAIQACARNLSLGRRSIYYFEAKECRVFPDFTPPLRPFEVSSNEISCDYDQEQVAEAELPQFDKWQRSGIQYFERLFTSHLPSDIIRGNNRSLFRRGSTFENFQYHTSWLFDQYLPFEPLPKQVVVPSSESLQHLRLRAYHDSGADNIYRMERVCISPFGGLSGYQPQMDAFYGRDESRDKFFQLYSSKALLIHLQPLQTPPTQFEQRPFVLFEIGHAGCMDNLAHQMLRLLSLIGTLRMNPWDLEDEHKKIDSRRNPLGFSIKPLLVIIWRATSKDGTTKTPLTAAFGMYLRILDLPWASILLPDYGNPRNARTYTRNVMSGMWSAKGRGPFHHEQGDVLDTVANNNRTTVCFRRGIIWQNCKNCPLDLMPYEQERYSWGMFSQPSRERIAILNDYRRMTRLCLTGQPKFPHKTAAAAAVLPLPIVFFDIREKDRFLSGSAVYLDLVRLRTSRFVGGIVFTEPGQGSRAAYIEKLRASNIFIGSHGAAFTGVSLMPRKSVVVELSFPHHTFRCSFSSTCWFSPFSRALGHEHFVVDVNVSYTQLPSTKSFVVGWTSGTSPAALSDAIVEAGCRWAALNSGFIAGGGGVGDSTAGAVADKKLVARCKLRGLWRRRYSQDEPTLLPIRVGDDEHLADLILVLTGQSVSIISSAAAAASSAGRSVPLAATLPNAAQQLRAYFAAGWSSSQPKLEGDPPEFWAPLLQQWIRVLRPLPGIRVSWRGEAESPSRGNVKIACLEVVEGRPWCLYGPPMLSLSVAAPTSTTLPEK